MIQIAIGLNAEGPTDIRFLKNIVKRTFDEVAFDCDMDIEILDIAIVHVKKTSFVETMLNAAREAFDKYGITVLCIHADSDAVSQKAVVENKFVPFLEALSEKEADTYCKMIVPVIPIQMTESWMLADKNLFKRLINVEHERDDQLGIEKNPEVYSDPKNVIRTVLQIANQNTRRRRCRVEISDLYEEIGNQIELDKLRMLPSFRYFEGEVRSAFQKLNFLH
ncbi:DUF4276 family protein [Parabacteroides sp. PF5-6]|uniref:DUF4276 family protein n=1 Tax=Parabacteroides sp. PF5-6 TaxID=1742403 RepID=UPI002404EA56|nr:DUF4276 family protein [Parabacteroides sp. PF5-6]MDF9830626.1 hypothetical protein [Parabacteroides sp. PF5-6]